MIGDIMPAKKKEEIDFELEVVDEIPERRIRSSAYDAIIEKALKSTDPYLKLKLKGKKASNAYPMLVKRIKDLKKDNVLSVRMRGGELFIEHSI